MNNLCYAIRQIIKRPGFSLVIVLMLAIGIGATTAMFSLFHQILVQPLPVPEPDRLVNIVRISGRSFSYPMFRDLEAQQSVFSHVAAHNMLGVSVSHEGGAFNVPGVFVSGGYFPALNLQPALGRLIGPQDEPRLDESPVVVLSHALWQDRFGGDPDIVGRPLTINGQSLTVIGIAPASFAGTQLGVRAQIFVPFSMYWQLQPSFPREAMDNRNFHWISLFARLRPGVTFEQATSGINTVYSGILSNIEAPLRALSENEMQEFLRERVELLPGARGQGSIEDAAQSLTLLLGVTLLVLLIICLNIANLLLVRGASRAGEMAICESLGASRGRLLAQLLTETAVPVAIGGILSLPIAVLILDTVARILPARLADVLFVQINPAAAAIAALATVAALFLCGLFPALRTTRMNPALAMKGCALQSLGGHETTRVRGALATAQIAFSMVLLVLAGLFARSLLNVARIDLGIDVDSLVSFSVAPQLNGYSPERTAVIYDEIERELAAQPGVTGVASAALPIVAGADFQWGLQVEGFDNGGEPISARFNMVGPSFFNTLSIPLLAGREFTASDTSGPPRVAIINQHFAREYGLDDSALGKHLRFGPDDANNLKIIGVVSDAAYSAVKDKIPSQFFVPRSASGEGNPFSPFMGSASFYVRTTIDPNILLSAIPRVIANIDPTLPVNNLITMRRQVQDNIFLDRLVTILSASFAAVATLLAAIGLYGVLAYSVTQRTRELGLRLALGAEQSDLRVLVLKQVGLLALIGIFIGLGAAIALGRVAESLLFGLSGHDPVVLVAATFLIGIVVFLAGLIPAMAAARIEPMEALRYE